MARERMVTRTVEFTEAEVMCVNVNTADVAIRHFIVTGTFDNNEKLMKSLKKAYETEEVKLVNLQNSRVTEQLYGMTEEMFIQMATILPPRN